MNDITTLILSAPAGLLLGAFFFGGLWWSPRKALNSDRAAVWYVGSWFVRMGVSLLGFYMVGGGQWQRLMACLFGFVIARILLIRMTGRVGVHRGAFASVSGLAKVSDLSDASQSSIGGQGAP